MKLLSKKVEPYDLYLGVHDDYLYLEVFPYPEVPVANSMKIPMTKLYAEEISYALDMDDWEEKDLEGWTDKQDFANFVQADMPKLLAWWVHFLPIPKKRKVFSS